MRTNCKNCGTKLVKKSGAMVCPQWKPNNRGCKGDYVKISLNVTEYKPLTLTPNINQESIIDWIKDAIAGKTQSKKLIVNSDAGTGKTTTLAMLSAVIPTNLQTVYVTFNNENKQEAELSGKFPDNVRIKTFHGESLANLFNAARQGLIIKPKVDNSKIYKYMAGLELELSNSLIAEVSYIVGLLKNLLLTPGEESLTYILERFDYVPENDINLILQWAKQVYDWSIQNTSIIDFNDMLTLPIIRNLPVKQYDVILVDEMQDQNPARIELLKKMSHNSTIMIMVGDDKQAIMGFTGAAYNGMNEYRETFNADMLPLQITWRYSQIILDFIKGFFPNLQTVTMNQNTESVAGFVSEFDLLSFESDLLVLCRNNAPLIKPCLDLIKHGKKAYIKGRDIMANLKMFVYKHGNDNTSIDQWFENYDQWFNALMEKVKKLNPMTLDKINDNLATIQAIIENGDCKTVREIVQTLDNIFSDADNKKAITFSTGHKSKGLESESVLIINPELIPSKYATTEDQIIQENNLLYVMLTRAKNNLWILS